MESSTNDHDSETWKATQRCILSARKFIAYYIKTIWEITPSMAEDSSKRRETNPWSQI